MKPSTLRHGMNLWPPFLFAGIRVCAIDADFRSAEVELRMRPWNRNYVGTHFGGSLFAMADQLRSVGIPGTRAQRERAQVRARRCHANVASHPSRRANPICDESVPDVSVPENGTRRKPPWLRVEHRQLWRATASRRDHEHDICDADWRAPGCRGNTGTRLALTIRSPRLVLDR